MDEQDIKNDPSLLARIDERTKIIRQEIKDISCAVSIKADSKDLLTLSDNIKDHEKRIRSIEEQMWKAIGILVFLQIAVPIAVKFFWK